MRQAFDISTHLHDPFNLLISQFRQLLLKSAPLHLCAPKCSINEWLSFHCSIFQLSVVLSLITGFHLLLSYFHQAFLTFSSLLCPSHAPPWSSLIWLIINSSDFTNFIGCLLWQFLLFILGKAILTWLLATPDSQISSLSNHGSQLSSLLLLYIILLDTDRSVPKTCRKWKC